MFRFEPRYIDNVRYCDNPTCHNHEHLRRYNNDLNIDLLFCSTHINNPYGSILDIVPIFNKNNYKLLTDNNNDMCNFVGCNQFNGLKTVYDNLYCVSHAKIIINNRINSLIDKKDIDKIVLSKIREFLYKKVLDNNLIKDILSCERKMSYSTFHCNINMVHYMYVYNNKINNQIDNNYTLFDKTNKEYFNNLYSKNNVLKLNK